MVLFYFLLLIFVFISGMTILRTGLFSISGDSLKLWLAKVTDKPWKGLFAGLIVTSILQSSSAVMIITIGLISTRMLTFSQSIGIILGTNIGTTFTAEIITFDIQSYLVPLIILGTVLVLTNKEKFKSIGLSLIGISLVFLAMSGFEYLANPLKEMQVIQKLLLFIDNSHIASILIGALITAIIQSSTATTGIIMGFLSSGVINIDTGIAVMFGSNIGTCVDALLAAIGGGKEAKLSAYAHIWLNVIGVIAFYPMINYLSNIAPSLANSGDVQLAHISLLFNVICSVAVLPFANVFSKLILTIHK